MRTVKGCGIFRLLLAAVLAAVPAGMAALASAPVVDSVSPGPGAAGLAVTISGSGFGTVQGAGSVWLGSTRGVVSNWSDTQIIATVAANATSGSVAVHQGGVWSNATPFSVVTATILGVTPGSALPGATVTITGSGFGASQGMGQVWLGQRTGLCRVGATHRWWRKLRRAPLPAGPRSSRMGYGAIRFPLMSPGHTYSA
jgi:hypothetical protein